MTLDTSPAALRELALRLESFGTELLTGGEYDRAAKAIRRLAAVRELCETSQVQAGNNARKQIAALIDGADL